MYVTETSLATEKQIVLDLKAALQKVEEEVRQAKEEAQLIREVTEAEKKATYQLGVKKLKPGSLRKFRRCAGITAVSHGLMPLMLQGFLQIRR